MLCCLVLRIVAEAAGQATQGILCTSFVQQLERAGLSRTNQRARQYSRTGCYLHAGTTISTAIGFEQGVLEASVEHAQYAVFEDDVCLLLYERFCFPDRRTACNTETSLGLGLLCACGCSHITQGTRCRTVPGLSIFGLLLPVYIEHCDLQGGLYREAAHEFGRAVQCVVLADQANNPLSTDSSQDHAPHTASELEQLRLENKARLERRTSLVPVRIALYLNLAAAQVKVCEATNDKLYAKHALANCNKACSLAVLFSIQVVIRS